MRNVEHLIPEAHRSLMLAAAALEEQIGVYLDVPEHPAWARQIARWDYDEARAECRCEWRVEAAIPSELHGIGRGKRALGFRLAMGISPSLFAGAQSYNNCAAWCQRANNGCALAFDIAAKGELHAYEADPGTAVTWAYRGSRGNTGMTLDRCAWVGHNVGVQLRRKYLDGKYDFTGQSADESYGLRWGGSGAPKDLLDAIAGDKIEQIGEVRDEEAVLDALYLGGSIMTGSTLTAASGDPVSPLTRIGGHAQALVGYDDTDEFRAWYQQTTGKRLDDWVGIFDQSWYPNWITVKNWPTQLWGDRPEGAFVLAGRDAMQLVRQSPTFSADSKGARVFNSVVGFPLRTLPDWGSRLYL